VIEAETCCHLVTLNKINIHNTSCVLTYESLPLLEYFTDFTFNLFACTYVEFMALLKFRFILQNTNSVEGDTMQGRTGGEASESELRGDERKSEYFKRKFYFPLSTNVRLERKPLRLRGGAEA